MKNGKYANNNRKRRLRWSKQFVLLASIAVLLVGVIGGSLAYLFTNTDPVVNTFTPGKVNIKVEETLGENTKSNVSIKNTGNVKAKIKAMVVITWQNANGDVFHKQPEPVTDYTIKWGESTKWSPKALNTWCIYSDEVEAGNLTETLIDEIKVIKQCEDANYKLVVDVIAEAIQAEGGASF